MSIRLLTGTVLAALMGAASAQTDTTYPAMYFHSQVRDASICSMDVNKSGDIVFGEGISNPDASCADAAGWKQMLEAIRSEFWTNWANDETVWVASPRPVRTDASPNNCCFVDPGQMPQVGYRDASGKMVRPSDIGGPGVNCPYIPGDYGGAHKTTFSGGKPVTSHNSTFLRTQDPARIARQQEVEVVYRNDPFVRYTTSRDLYSRAGLSRLFARVAGEAANSVPYRPTRQGASYPPDAAMFKVDWIPEKTMLELGYIKDHDKNPSTPPQNPEHPYITMKIKASTDDGKAYNEGLYYLAAITGASKALPNWHWYAFEHVDNLGRCDYTGCNDSYGFHSTVEIADPNNPNKSMSFATNFITPHTTNDQLDDSTQLFDLGKAYPSGDMSDGLAALFKSTGIGSGANPVNPDVPKTSDPAWKSYRFCRKQHRASVNGTMKATFSNGSATT